MSPTFALIQAHEVSSLIPISILALVHLFAKELNRIEVNPRNALLSAGAGASLAYVLLSILPKLAEKQESLTSSVDTGLRGFLEHHAYIVAMIGLVAYYGVSRIAVYGREAAGSETSPRYRAATVATVVFYAAYSLLIGYLIAKRDTFGLLSISLITIGMGALFLGSDYGLQKKWPAAYQGRIRWVLTIALLAGWALAVWHDTSANVVALWYALLAGMMLITTIGEKISLENRGSFWAFLAGVGIFTALLLIFERIP